LIRYRSQFFIICENRHHLRIQIAKSVLIWVNPCLIKPYLDLHLIFSYLVFICVHLWMLFSQFASFFPSFSSFHPQNPPVLYTFLCKTNPIPKTPKLTQPLICQTVTSNYLRNLRSKTNPKRTQFYPRF
jgi:hypothetical protein